MNGLSGARIVNIAQMVSEDVDGDDEEYEKQARPDGYPPLPDCRKLLPLRISVPSDGVVTGMPIPRKLNVALGYDGDAEVDGGDDEHRSHDVR